MEEKITKLLDKIEQRITEIQEDCLDENSNFRNPYEEGIYDGLSKLESYIDSLIDN